jgi:hypothetical protein
VNHTVIPELAQPWYDDARNTFIGCLMCAVASAAGWGLVYLWLLP